jgi:hydroxyacylglutathione hydrolase
MQILRTHVPKSANNYNHLVYCPQTRVAAAIDPFSAEHLLALAKAHNLVIQQIWVTHEHHDHIRHVDKLKELTGAPVFAPTSCHGKLDADHWLDDEQQLTLGQHQITHLLTPGHTPGHGVYIYTDTDQSDNDFILSGDTLFNAGVGNVNSGDASMLFQTVMRLAARLTPMSSLYSGHDYLVTNLNFTLHHWPENISAQQTLLRVEPQTPDQRSIQRWQDECRYNLFLNLDSDRVKQLTDIQDAGGNSSQQRFIALRRLRDQW